MANSTNKFDGNTTLNGTIDDDALFTFSAEAYKEFLFVSNMVAIPVICVVGLIGNSLGLGVLWKDSRQQKLSVYYYLCALTFFDILYLFFGLLRSIPHMIEFYDERLGNFIREHMKLGTIYTDLVIGHTSTAIIIVISVERLIALLRPLTVKTYWISRYPKRLVPLCFLFNIVFLLPYALCFKLSSHTNGNATVYILVHQPQCPSVMATYSLLHPILYYFIPACVVLITNIAIIVGYSRSLIHRQASLNITSQRQNNHQIKITTTVISITIAYLLLSMPNLFILLLKFVDKDYSPSGKHRLLFWLFIDISDLFVYVNAANDFVFYILLSNHHRKIFLSRYCRLCMCSRRRNLNEESQETDRYSRPTRNLESDKY